MRMKSSGKSITNSFAIGRGKRAMVQKLLSEVTLQFDFVI